MKPLLLISFAFLSMNLSAQLKKSKSWKVTDAGVTYRLPDSWRSDPFSSSSVCDCSGTINDNGEWDSLYLGMVVYNANYPVKDSSNRNQVWDYEWKPSDKGEEVMINGIKFIRKKGTLANSATSNTAWQYVSIDGDETKKHILVYFFGLPEKFEAEIKLFLDIMATFKRE